MASATEWLTAAEAAAYLKVNGRTLLRWARDAYVPATPIGEGRRRLWRFLETDLERWMRARQTGTLGAAIGAPVREEHDQQH